MTRKDIIDTLRILLPQVSGLNVALIGSANLCLQGIDIVPGDIDFITDDTGVETVSEIFHSEINKENPYIKTEFMLGDFEIEFVSVDNNPLRPDDYLDNRELVTDDGLNIPVISLKAEYGVYEQMGRDKDKLKMKQIKELIG